MREMVQNTVHTYRAEQAYPLNAPLVYAMVVKARAWLSFPVCCSKAEVAVVGAVVKKLAGTATPVSAVMAAVG